MKLRILIHNILGMYFFYLVLYGGSSNAQVSYDTERHYYGDSIAQFGYSFHQCADSGYMLFGTQYDSTTYHPNILVVKTNHSADQLWSKKFYSDTSLATYFDAYCYSDNKYIILGHVVNSQFKDNIFLAAMSDNGDLLWQRSYYDSSVSEGGFTLIEVSGGFLIGGYKMISPTYNYQKAYFMRVDSLGNKLTEKSYIFTYEDDYVLKIVKSGNQLYALIPTFQVINYGDAMFVKINESGIISYSKEIDQAGDENFLGMIGTHDGGFLTWGWTWFMDWGFYYKLDSLGNMQWNYIDEAEHIPVSVIQLPSGSIVGSYVMYALGSLLIRNIGVKEFDAQGYQLSDYSISSPDTFELCWELQCENDSTLLFFGYSDLASNQQSFKYLFIKETIGELSTGIPAADNFSDDNYLHVYPNPASDFINVETGAANSFTEISDANLLIIDLLGQIRKQISLKGVEGKIKIDISDLQVGIYLCELMINKKEKYTCKLVVAKK